MGNLHVDNNYIGEDLLTSAYKLFHIIFVELKMAMDWRITILQALRLRNQKESEPFKELVTSCKCVFLSFSIC